MGYDPTGYINWWGVAAGITMGILAVGAVALTVMTAGAASPLAGALIATAGTVVSAALVETAVVTTAGAFMEAPVVYDGTLTNGHDRSGCSVVYDFSTDITDVYLHTGTTSSAEYSATYGVGFVFDYNVAGDYGGVFVDVSASAQYKGASLGIDYCTDPNNLSLRTPYSAGSHAALFTSGISIPMFAQSSPFSFGMDYYWQVAVF